SHSHYYSFQFSSYLTLLPRPPTHTLFPYTTLFRSKVQKQTSDMQKAMMGMHAQFTLSDDTIEKAVAKTPAGVGAHIHVAEGISEDRKSTRLNSSHVSISYAVFCLKKNRKLKV